MELENIGLNQTLSFDSTARATDGSMQVTMTSLFNSPTEWISKADAERIISHLRSEFKLDDNIAPPMATKVEVPGDSAWDVTNKLLLDMHAELIQVYLDQKTYIEDFRSLDTIGLSAAAGLFGKDLQSRWDNKNFTSADHANIIASIDLSNDIKQYLFGTCAMIAWHGGVLGMPPGDGVNSTLYDCLDACFRIGSVLSQRGYNIKHITDQLNHVTQSLEGRLQQLTSTENE